MDFENVCLNNSAEDLAGRSEYGTCEVERGNCHDHPLHRHLR